MIKKTNSRQKKDLAPAILAAAMELFVQKGVAKTSLRNIAERIGYSPANVYLYFKNKDEILHAVHREGFKKLRAQFNVLHVVSDPVARLKALGKVYLQFAAENPGLYELMFNSAAPMQHLANDETTCWDEGRATFQVLRQTIQDCMAAGKFAGHELEATSFMIWSTVHGMASLANAQRIEKVIFTAPTVVVAQAYRELERMIDKL